MRLVLDTNVVVAAMRSPAGASAALLRLARQNKITLLANVALAVEYEAICLMSQHLDAAELNRREGSLFLDAVMAMIEPVETHFMWRPQLRDPADEFVLEAAVNGRAQLIVTFNGRDFTDIPAHFGLDVLTPSQAMKRIRL